MNSKNYQYYNNKENYSGICVPKRKDAFSYLLKEKFLSEFSTEEEKKKVLYNLGIAQEFNRIIQIINENADVPDLEKFITLAQLIEKLQTVTEQFNTNINSFKEEVSDNVESLNNDVESLKEEDIRVDERLRLLEEGGFEPKDSFKHKLITTSSYHNLDQYDRNTLYLVVDSFNESTSVYGDHFPLILGGEITPSHFGDKFPIVLDGELPSQESTHFGDTFPLTFGNSNYYIGSKFPIVFKQ